MFSDIKNNEKTDFVKIKNSLKFSMFIIIMIDILKKSSYDFS